MSALNPKVSLLVKLARVCQIILDSPKVLEEHLFPGIDGLLSDAEILTWLNCMAELEYITKIPSTERQEGYQISATDRATGYQIASYYEKDNPGDAMISCLHHFPKSEGYTNHTVRKISSNQEISLPTKNLIAEPTSLSLDED